MVLPANMLSILLPLSFFALALAKAPQMRDITGRQATDDSTTVSSSASPASTSSPVVLIIYTPNQMTTCQSSNITWDYNGPVPAQLTLRLTDVSVDQSGASTQPHAITQTLENNIDINVTNGNWTWKQVNVSSGYYIVEGSVNDSDSTRTEPFFIANGSDTSCLSSQVSPITSSSLAAARKINVGAIVGGILGGIAIVVAILALLFFRRFKRPSHRPRVNKAKWTKFPSTDSHDLTSGTPFSYDNRQISASSFTSHDLVSATPLSYDNRQMSTSSFASNPTNYSRPRVPSTRNSARNSADAIAFNVRHQHSRKHSSLDVLDARLERSPSVPSVPPSTYRPPQSSSEMIPLGRSASTQSTSNRRTSRKPVPQYDASELENRSSSNDIDSPPFDSEGTPVLHLNRKPSFGDVRPVHYLIPDMPPPTKS